MTQIQQLQLATQNEKLLPYAREPLTVTIHGNGSCTGKSVLQFLLAEFLSSLGHRVSVSDACVSESVFKKTLERHSMTGHPAKVVSQEIHLNVASTPALLAPAVNPVPWKLPPIVTVGFTEIKWKRQPNGSWKNQHGEVMSAKAMKKREERSKGHFFDKRVSVP